MYKKEIKAAAIKYAEYPLFPGKEYRSMAKRFPDGELSFYRKKRFEYLEQIKGTALGQMWINSDCPDLITMTNFLDVIDNAITEHYQSKFYGHLAQEEKDKLAIDQIDSFMRLWLEYRAIDAIIMDLEQDYSELFGKLSEYITDVNITEFNNIVRHHSLSPGTPRATWIGSPADAHRLASKINMKVADWNKCFKGVKDRSGNLRPLRPNDKDKNSKLSEINNILENFLNK